MILTLKGLAGQQGALGADEMVPAPGPAWSYNRVLLVILVSFAAVLSIVGVAAVGWHLAKGNAGMAVVSLLIDAAGIYLFLGILKELANLDFLVKHAAKLSKPAKDELLKRMIAENSNSVFRLVETLLQAVERTSSGKANRRAGRSVARG
jgi:hypothetical protein